MVGAEPVLQVGPEAARVVRVGRIGAVHRGFNVGIAETSASRAAYAVLALSYTAVSILSAMARLLDGVLRVVGEAAYSAPPVRSARTLRWMVSAAYG